MNDGSDPIALSGPGSQPTGLDGQELDILQLPSGMDTYTQPDLPEPEDAVGLESALELLWTVQRRMADFHPGMSTEAFDLSLLDSANGQLIDQVMGEGEVSVLFSGRYSARIQESVLAGLWRVQYLNEAGEVTHDSAEIGPIPSLVVDAAWADATGRATTAATDTHPDAHNAPPLIAELNHQLAGYTPGDPPHVINLTLLPQSEQDLAFLTSCLGQGAVTILSRGYGNCRISSTRVKHLWWVQYFNSQDRNILNTLEISQVPAVACAASEDILDSSDRLREILDIYR